MPSRYTYSFFYCGENYSLFCAKILRKTWICLMMFFFNSEMFFSAKIHWFHQIEELRIQLTVLELLLVERWKGQVCILCFMLPCTCEREDISFSNNRYSSVIHINQFMGVLTTFFLFWEAAYWFGPSSIFVNIGHSPINAPLWTPWPTFSDNIH